MDSFTYPTKNPQITVSFRKMPHSWGLDEYVISRSDRKQPIDSRRSWRSADERCAEEIERINREFAAQETGVTRLLRRIDRRARP